MEFLAHALARAGEESGKPTLLDRGVSERVFAKSWKGFEGFCGPTPHRPETAGNEPDFAA